MTNKMPKRSSGLGAGLLALALALGGAVVATAPAEAHGFRGHGFHGHHRHFHHGHGFRHFGHWRRPAWGWTSVHVRPVYADCFYTRRGRLVCD